MSLRLPAPRPVHAGWLALDDPHRPEARNAHRESGALHYLDHLLDLLVRERGLLGQAAVRGRAHGDALLLQPAAQLAALDLLPCCGPAEPPPCSMADRSERSLHRPGATGEHIARRAHASRDEHRLARFAVAIRDLHRPGRERPGRALAVDAQLPVAVALDLRHVVRDVVYLPRAGRRLLAQDPLDRLPDTMGEQLTVRPCEVRGSGHRGQVRAALGRGRGRTGELTVRQPDPVAVERPHKALYEVGADLVAEAARARVDQDCDLTVVQPQSFRRHAVVDTVDPLHLEEVVSRSERPELVRPALARPLRKGRRVGAVEASLRL